MFGMEISLNVAQRAHSVKYLLFTMRTILTQAKEKLFLDVLRTWKQLRYIAATAMAAAATATAPTTIANRREEKKTHTQTGV